MGLYAGLSAIIGRLILGDGQWTGALEGVGAALFAFIGGLLIARSFVVPVENNATLTSATSNRGGFIVGSLMICLNPQMALFYLTIVPQTGFLNLLPWLDVLLLIFLIQPLGHLPNHIRGQRKMKLISGAMLILMSGNILIG